MNIFIDYTSPLILERTTLMEQLKNNVEKSKEKTISMHLTHIYLTAHLMHTLQ